jgi:hypothetical protein
MRFLTTEQLRETVVQQLGLRSTEHGWDSIEFVVAALRRTAGFLCPCSPSTLSVTVAEALRGLVAPDQARTRLDDALEAMIAYGDILEAKDHTYGTSSVLLYAAPPAFFRRESGVIFLIGVTPDHLSPLPTDLQSQVEYVGHTRSIASKGEDLAQDLRDLGMIELNERAWLRAPALQLALQHARQFDLALERVPIAHDIPGLTILDSLRPASFYRGRWTEPASHAGRFVGRRRQAYGADLWCYVDLRDSGAKRFIDLPLFDDRLRGCDEAWRLQMAIDANRGKPQRLTIRPANDGTVTALFFSPVPLWARRRWDTIGKPGPDSGCLFSYVFPEAEITEEIRFAREMMWLETAEFGRAG